LPGACYLVTRRCTQRQFLLKPSKTTNDVFLYVLAVAAERFRIRVHALCVLSNHYHLLVTDPLAQLPAFHQLLDALTARALNSSLGRWETFWAPNSYSAVTLGDPTDIVEKAAYVLANPVAAGLVPTGRQWPGLWSAPEQIGTALEVCRPKHFFDPKGCLPEKVQLELTVPPGFSSADEFRARLTAALAEHEATAHKSVSGAFLGVARVLRQNPCGQPAPGEPRRSLNPRVAARDKWKRVEMLGRLVAFLKPYRSAWAARRAGRLATVFPRGTYMLRIVHGVQCEGFG
jgi:REP element-mobilizing transposase RayT